MDLLIFESRSQTVFRGHGPPPLAVACASELAASTSALVESTFGDLPNCPLLACRDARLHGTHTAPSYNERS